MKCLMKYLAQFEKWFQWKSEPEDLKSIVENEIDSNVNIVLVAHRLGRYIKSKNIIIPLQNNEKIVVRKIGNKSQIKKDKVELEIDRKEFNRWWYKCIDKKYKFVWK